MAKKSYTGTKLGITASIAGLTMLTAGWLAAPLSGSNYTVELADTGTLSQENVAALATATPSISTTTAATVTQATATSTTAVTSSTSSTSTTSTNSTTSTTAKTSRGS
ncbi:MAG: hypothetical protein AB7N24_18820 [Dehalococcoidia bacterium]